MPGRERSIRQGLQTPRTSYGRGFHGNGPAIARTGLLSACGTIQQHPPTFGWKFQKGPLQGNVKLDLLVPVLCREGECVYRPRCDIIPLFLNLFRHHLAIKPLLHPYYTYIQPSLPVSTVGNKRNFLNNCPVFVIAFFGVCPSFTVNKRKNNNIGVPLICYLDYNSPTWSSNQIFRSTHFPQHPLDTLAQDRFRQKPAVAGHLISKMARSLRRVKILQLCHRGHRSDRQ